jgi:hypothetical protein
MAAQYIMEHMVEKGAHPPHFMADKKQKSRGVGKWGGGSGQDKTTNNSAATERNDIVIEHSGFLCLLFDVPFYTFTIYFVEMLLQTYLSILKKSSCAW